MSVRDFAPGKEITSPRGMWSVLAQKRKGTPQRGSLMQNARITPGVAGSRDGTSAVVAASGKVTGLYNWVTPAGVSLALYLDNGEIKLYDQTAAPANLLAAPGTMRRPSFTDLDIWAYIAGYDTSGNGVMQAQVTDGSYVQAAFRPPLILTAANAVDGGPDPTPSASDPSVFSSSLITNLNSAGQGDATLSMNVDPAITDVEIHVGSPTGPLMYLGSGVGTTAEAAGWVVDGMIFYLLNHADSSTIAWAIAHTQAGLTPTNPGYCTAGTHYIGFVYTDRTGHSGVPTTTVGGDPIKVTLNAGLRRINVQVTLPAIPDGGGLAFLSLIMTRADNQATWYFMPDDTQTGAVGTQPVPLNTVTTLNFVANLSDEDMASELAGDTANENFLLLTQAADGTGPFNPSQVLAYGQRMCYVVDTQIYISEPNDPQYLTGDQHVVSMPNKPKVGAAFQLPGSTDLYLTGDRWTAKTSDTGDVPATWGQPLSTSKALGAVFPSLICSRTRGPYAWIVTEGGVYLFDGNYGDKPVTYLVNDQWERVNWKAAYAIEIADDVVALRTYVGIPLDGATEPNAMFVIDYTNGLEFDQCDISLDVFNPAAFSSIGIVKEKATDISNLWIGPSAAGNIAHFDPTTKNDQGNSIESFWECGLVRGKNDFNSRMIRVGNLDIWARGSGNPIITVYGPDRVQSVNAPLLSGSGIPATLSDAPGMFYQSKFDLAHVENYTIRFGTNAVGDWWELSELVGYAKGDLYNR